MLGPALTKETAPGYASSLVAGWWSSTVSGSATVVPDGAVDLMWSSQRGPWVAGPDTGPRPVDLEAGTTVVGLRLRAGVANRLLGSGVDQAADRQVPLSSVLTHTTFTRLEDELGSSASPQEVARRLCAAMVRLVSDSWSPDTTVIDAAERLRLGYSVDRHGLSERQFRRRFRSTMGIGPTFYRRVMRLDRFTDLHTAYPSRSISELAAQAGYFDESHLARDCVALTGSTPGQLRSQG